MKIVFICGSVEPGLDGVGDYVFCLAKEVIKQGHHPAVVAFNDTHIDTVMEFAESLNGNMPLLRLPSNMSNKERLLSAKVWINKLNPDWVSLQYVPYAYHPKGFPVYLSYGLKGVVAAGRKIQFMVHETWISPRGGLKPLLTSLIQKALLKKLIRSAKPIIIHTHLPKYRIELERFQKNVKCLPLFSNIIFVPEKKVDNRSLFKIGFFSQIERSDSILQFLIEFVKSASAQKKQCELWIFGQTTNKIIEIGSFINKQNVFEKKVSYSGFLSPTDLTKALQSCDLGITSVPRHALGKSGSVAAFLAHGIPVAAPNYTSKCTQTESGFFSSALESAILLHPDIVEFQRVKRAAQDAMKEIEVSRIAKTFISDLISANIAL